SPPATFPSSIMTTPASRATGIAATSSSASSVTAITALADLSAVRSAYQPVITPTSQGSSPSEDRAQPTHITRYAAFLHSTHLTIRIIPLPSSALTVWQPSGFTGRGLGSAPLAPPARNVP